MGKYLKKFETTAEYETFIASDYDKPNVSLTKDNNVVHYNPWVEPPFFCKLTLNNGEVVEIEGSGQLTETMIYDYETTLVGVEIGELCTDIDGFTFSYCKYIDNITVNANNTVYDSRNNCNAIIETATNTLIVGSNQTIIPNSVTSIGYSAFASRNGFSFVEIPNSVTNIGGGAFGDCSSLTSVTIPDSVTNIDMYAFSNCSSLTSVTIGSGVTSIGERAFHRCRALASVTIEATTPPTLIGDVFLDNASGRKIFVPSVSVEAYKTAEDDGWFEYTADIEPIPTN